MDQLNTTFLPLAGRPRRCVAAITRGRSPDAFQPLSGWWCPEAVLPRAMRRFPGQSKAWSKKTSFRLTSAIWEASSRPASDPEKWCGSQLTSSRLGGPTGQSLPFERQRLVTRLRIGADFEILAGRIVPHAADLRGGKARCRCLRLSPAKC